MPFKKILITGSSGTIGTRLCEVLLEKKYSIVCIDRKPNLWNQTINKMTVLADLRSPHALKQVQSIAISASPNPTSRSLTIHSLAYPQASLRSASSFHSDFDLVIHLAANSRAHGSVLNPKLSMENLKILFNVLEFCRVNKVKNFIFASSREVYGNSANGACSEKEARITQAQNPYAASKLGGEAVLHAYAHCYGINFIVIRYSNVYGRYDDSTRVVPYFIRRTHENKNLLVYGSSKKLDLIFIDDAIQGTLQCINNFKRLKNEIVNLGFGQGISILNVAHLIHKLMKGKNKVLVQPNRIGEVDNFTADISKLRKKLGFAPRTLIAEGLERSIEWHRKNIFHD